MQQADQEDAWHVELLKLLARSLPEFNGFLETLLGQRKNLNHDKRSLHVAHLKIFSKLVDID